MGGGETVAVSKSRDGSIWRLHSNFELWDPHHIAICGGYYEISEIGASNPTKELKWTEDCWMQTVEWFECKALNNSCSEIFQTMQVMPLRTPEGLDHAAVQLEQRLSGDSAGTAASDGDGDGQPPGHIRGGFLGACRMGWRLWCYQTWWLKPAINDRINVWVYLISIDFIYQWMWYRWNIWNMLELSIGNADLVGSIMRGCFSYQILFVMFVQERGVTAKQASIGNQLE